MGVKKSNILIAALVAIIMILLAFIGVLVYKNFYDGKKNPTEEYYDNKCLAFGVQNANASKGQIVFIGDSITDFYLLDDHYADLPFACYNRGIGGDTTSGVLKRLKVSLFDITPKTVVLLIGTNDINGGVGDEVILSNYRQIIDEIFDNLPGVELYCVSIIPQNEQLQTYSEIDVATTTEKILRLNPEIRGLAEERGATYVDLFSAIADANNRLIGEYSDDGLHLNEAGLGVWTDIMMPYFTEEREK